MTLCGLPPEPSVLCDGKGAARIKEALEELYRADDLIFHGVFCSVKGNVVNKWISAGLSRHIELLAERGLLQRAGDRLFRCPYLITPWNGAFYLADFPDSGDPLEVFSPHPETKFFSTMLQVRAGDSVLDLGTGSGILLLEAARRGCSGLGIDISERAIAFAKANAYLNSVQDRVEFLEGDMTVPPGDCAWGKPSIVISNPPFEPVPDDPDFPQRPRHSHGGPLGTMVIEPMLEVLAGWSHQPALIQLIMFSLGPEPEEQLQPDRLQIMNPLRSAAEAMNALIDVKELLDPIPLSEYLVLNFGSKHRRAKIWHKKLSEGGLGVVYLLFANLYAGASKGGSRSCSVQWTPHQNTWLDDECFLWPLASSHRGAARRKDLAVGELFGQYLSSLILSREKQMASEEVDLAFSNPRVQEFLNAMLQEIFGAGVPLIVIDLRSSADSARPYINAVLNLSASVSYLYRVTIQQLMKWAKDTLGPQAALTECTVTAKPPFLRSRVDAGDITDVVQDTLNLPPDFVQRFIVLSPVDLPLSPLRRRFFENTLSELAVLARQIRLEGSNISLTAIGHTLSHRIDPIERFFDDQPASIAKTYVKMLRDVGWLLQLCAVPSRKDLEKRAEDCWRDQGDEKNKRFFQTVSTEDPLGWCLGEHLTDWAALIVHRNRHGQEITPDLSFSLGTQAALIRILPFLSGNQTVAEFFYRELFLELFQNAAKHGANENNKVKVYPSLTCSSDGRVILMVKNAVSSTAERGKPHKLRPVKVTPNGRGLVVQLMRQLYLGDMWEQVRTSSTHPRLNWYSVAVALEGLADPSGLR